MRQGSKLSLKEAFGIIVWVSVVLALMFMRQKALDNAFPEHIVGKSGLIDTRHYLIVYIALSVGCAIAAGVSFLMSMILFLSDSHKPFRTLTGKIAAVIISILIGHVTFTGDNRNDLDIHAQKRHDSENGILKSISLLIDVNQDIHKEESRELYYTELSVKKKEYKYYRGKHHYEEDEPVIVNGKEIISQIGGNDGPTIALLLTVGGTSQKVELYKESGLLKSISGIEDFSEIDFSESEVELLKRMQK